MAFVTVEGPRFTLDGQPFRVNGANCYYAAHAPRPMVESVFDAVERFGFNVLRTSAFLDVAAPREDPWFQAGPGVYNDGANGLERLDTAVALAEQRGIRLILPLVNHWPDFGGMDQYAAWLGLARREDFYRDARAKDAYRRWLEHVVLRRNLLTGRQYRDEPAILAWELANEPRCAVEGGEELLVEWVVEMSAFVHALDPWHLVSVGDEGFFNWPEARRGHTCDGGYGVDSEALLAVPGVDFGVAHLYPSWQPEMDPAAFGARWIREHIEAAKRANKPMVIEEYGVKGAVGRAAVYSAWWDAIAGTDGAGALVWMVAAGDESGKAVPDYDGYTVYEPAEIPGVGWRTRRAT